MPALVDIARDFHAKIVVQKSAQVGLTELAVNRALHAADSGYAGRGNVLFLMPTLDQIEDFAQARFDAAIQDSVYLRRRLQPEPPRRKGADSMRQKQLGHGRIFLRGTESTRAVSSLDADLVILDEFDQMREGTLSRAEKRLASSRQPCLFVLSTPRLPEAGINALYLSSDQRRYFIPCPACGEEQSLTWNENVDMERAIIVCRTCRAGMNVLVQGGWRVGAPENTQVHGYHLSRLYSPWANIPEMILASQATTPLALQEFYNSDLGEPFVPPGGGLGLNELDAARRKYSVQKYAGQPCVMGVDVGIKLHVVIRETKPRRSSFPPLPEFQPRLWFAGQVGFDELDRLMTKFNVLSCAIDEQPERHKAREFLEQSQGGVWLVTYNRHEMGLDVQGRMIKAHRVDFMDQVVERFRRGEAILPEDARNLGGQIKDGYAEYYREMMAPKRVPFRDARGNFDYRWDEGARDDHYFHAEVYALIAEQVRDWHIIVPIWSSQ
jgi:hypothetical protein